MNVKGFKKYCISNAVDKFMMVCCGMAMKWIQILGVSVKNDKGTDYSDGESDTD